MTLIEWARKEYTNIKPGLTRIKNFFKKINISPDNLPIIHIAGTNAKGSVAVYLQQIFLSLGFKVGLFTSPHLIRINERIKINNTEISERDLRLYYNRYKKDFESFSMTFFEGITALAIVYFLEKNTDLAIMEVGVGGRYDATNICRNKLATVITNTDYDHMDLFGESLKDILSEDLGIIRKNTPLIVGDMSKQLLDIVKKYCLKMDAPLYILKKDYDYKNIRVDWTKRTQSFDFYNDFFRIKDIKIHLMAGFQIDNAAVATQTSLVVLKSQRLACLDKLRTQAEKIKEGLKRTTWPGRFDVKTFKGNKVIIDGAHNHPAIKRFVIEYKSTPFGFKKATLIFSILREKEHKKIIREISRITSNLYIYDLKLPRMRKVCEIKDEFKKYLPYNKIKIINNFNEIFSKKSKNPIVVIGSLYLAGKVLKFWKQHFNHR